MFILISTYLKPPADVDAVRPAHRAFLQQHYDRGAFLVSGPQVPRTGGVIVAAGNDRRQIEALMSEDPFVQHGMARYDIVEFEATMHADALAAALK